MSHRIVHICASTDIAESGKGVRFPVRSGHASETGFVIRYRGVVYGYLNRCAHVPIELDWTPGVLFDTTGSYLICATHGALYDPQTGRCVGGPCAGGRLQPLAVSEGEGQVVWHPDEHFQPDMAGAKPV